MRFCVIAYAMWRYKLAAPVKIAPPVLGAGQRTVAAGDHFVVAGCSVAVRGDGASGSTVRAATLVATGNQVRCRSGSPIHPKANAAGSALHRHSVPVFREIGGGARGGRRGQLVAGPALSDGCRLPPA